MSQTESLSSRKQLSLLAAAVNEFSLSLLQRLTSATLLEKSVFASPFSVSTALAMLALGSRGESLRQLMQGLGIQQLALSDGDDQSAHPAHKLFKEVSSSFGPLVLVR